MHRVGGEGGETLAFLGLVVGNAIGDVGKRRINTGGKAYSRKIRGKTGARKVLEIVGFRVEEGGWMGVEEGEWEEGWAREVKRELERGRFKFENEVRRGFEDNADRLEKKQPGT